MSPARARSYQRVPQAEVGALTPSGSSTSDPNAHMGSFDDDEDDDDELLGDDSAKGEDDDDELLKKQRSRKAALWSVKMHALLWIIGAGSVAYATDFFRVIFTDARVKK